jgi:hypothetical protein
VKVSDCRSCGATIYLIPSGKHYKWVTDPKRALSWHCGDDPGFPVKAHEPTERLTDSQIQEYFDAHP